MKNLLFIFFFFAVSCNVVKKSSATTKAKTDSTSLLHFDSGYVAKSDMSTLQFRFGDYEKTTTYGVDTVIDFKKSIAIPGRIDTIYKYVPRIITVVEKGHYNKAESSKKIDYDSGAIKKDSKTIVSNEEETVVKSKVSSRFGWLPLIIAVLFLALLAILYIKLK